MYYVGGAVAAFSIGFLAERYGRKWAIAVVSHPTEWSSSESDLTTRQSAILTLVSGALLAGSVNIAMFIVFRFFSGAG